MAYMDGKAAGRRTTPAGITPASAPAVDSNQSKVQGQTAKFRTYSHAPAAGVEVGNQVRLDTAGKGLNVAGRPSPMAVASRDKSLPAVENPSGVDSIPGKF